MVVPLWVRALRSRPLVDVLLLLLCAAAVGTSVLGPLSSRAVHQSTLRSALAQPDVSRRSMAVWVDLPAGQTYTEPSALVTGVFAAMQKGSARRLWTEPDAIVQSTGNVGWAVPSGRRQGASSRVAVSDAGCSGLVLTGGRCPRSPGEALLSAVDVRSHRLSVGSDVVLQPRRGPRTSLTVVGAYDADRSDPARLTRPGSLAGSLAAVTADDLAVTAEQAVALGVTARVTGRVTLRPDLTVADEPAAQAQFLAAASAVTDQDASLGIDTGIPDLLDGVDRQAHDAGVLITVAVVQAVLLSLLALAIVLQQLGRARNAEWGVGRLRGVPRARWLASVWVEPGLALVAGLPIGLLAGAGAARWSADTTLRAGTPVEVWRWPDLVVAGATWLSAVLALLLSSVGGLRRPLADLLQQSAERRRVTPVGAAGRSAVVLLALATIASLLTGGTLGGRGSQLGLLAPGLFALALAVLAVQLAVVLVRRRTTRPARSLAGLIALRQAARTPSSLNPAAVVAAAVALAVFATEVLTLSERNQDLRADAVVGADAVLTVTTPPGSDLLALVRAADPTGRWAMAVLERAASSDGGTSRVVAVDSSRLAAVSPRSTRWAGLADAASQLHPATASPLLLRGTRLTMDLTAVRTTMTTSGSSGSNISVGPLPPGPGLALTVVQGGRWQTVALGVVAPGTRRLSAPLPCAAGCRVVAISTVSSPGAAYEARFTVARVSTDAQPWPTLERDLRTPGRWHERVGLQSGPDPGTAITTTGTADGLVVHASDTQGGLLVQAVPSDIDDPLPAVLGPSTAVEPFPGRPGVVSGTGLDGQGQLLAVAARASVLPRALADGVLVDLGQASALSDPAEAEVVDEVWLAATAPVSVEQRLVAAGVHVQQRQRLADTRSVLQDAAPTRGAAAAVPVGWAALVVALLALGAARVVGAAERRTQWSALLDGGLSRSLLRRMVMLEVAVPALLGVVIGGLSGVGALLLAASRLPVVDLTAPGPPLDLGIDLGSVALFGGMAAVAVLVVAVLTAWLEPPDGAP